ncbi:MAG: hypothetical protein C0483_19295 [Pirellula sp.]|nr:hypothetical protein [Pirellula sp.]
MEQSNRDRVLAMLLPAILIALGYFLFFNEQKTLDEARAGLLSAQAAAVSPEAVGMQRMRLAEMQKEASDLKTATALLMERRKELASVGSISPVMRTQALRKLSGMLWERGLFPFEESALQGESTRLSPSFDGVLKTLAGPPAGTTVNPFSPPPVVSSNTSGEQRVWRIRFYGRYSDVLETLEALRDSGSPIIPISLTMSESRTETQWRSWTLLLWI